MSCTARSAHTPCVLLIYPHAPITTEQRVPQAAQLALPTMPNWLPSPIAQAAQGTATSMSHHHTFPQRSTPVKPMPLQPLIQSPTVIARQPPASTLTLIPRPHPHLLLPLDVPPPGPCVVRPMVRIGHEAPEPSPHGGHLAGRAGTHTALQPEGRHRPMAPHERSRGTVCSSGTCSTTVE